MGLFLSMARLQILIDGWENKVNGDENRFFFERLLMLSFIKVQFLDLFWFHLLSVLLCMMNGIACN